MEQINTLGTSLWDNLSQIKMEGPVLCGVMILLSLLICFEGYKLYRLALLCMGFAVGFSLTHKVLEALKVPLSAQQFLMAQTIVGIICAVISASLVKIGVFLIAYYFVKHSLAAPIAAFVLGLAGEKLSIPNFLTPILTSVIGLVAAFWIARLTADSLRPVIVILTAAVGGFALINYLVALFPVFPYDLSFMPPEGSMIWMGAKVFVTAAGVGIQGLKDN
ncbi:MAG: TMEM198/TM7SF3 family protein [Lachnospiraceae bacterium]|nr:TMEM198/TM7SF3 family protein [Lachnospiraceae bacterium]